MSDIWAFGGVAPGLRCSRLRHWPDESTQCQNDAAVHILWTDDGDNGLVCTEHAAELKKRHFTDAHPYDPLCSVGGAVWTSGKPSRCVVEEVPGTEAAIIRAHQEKTT